MMYESDLLEQIAAAKRRNKDLSTRLAQFQKSQRKWREKALAKTREARNLRAQLARRPLPKAGEKKYTAKEWRTHFAILQRIRSL